MSAEVSVQGTNTLYCELVCPHCGKKLSCEVGFRAGKIAQLSYRVGQRLVWDGPVARPARRPPDGNLKTIGYFECSNLECETWQDCYPEVQEALITITSDVIAFVEPVTHRPNEMVFDILEPEEST